MRLATTIVPANRERTQSGVRLKGVGGQCCFRNTIVVRKPSHLIDAFGNRLSCGALRKSAVIGFTRSVSWGLP